MNPWENFYEEEHPSPIRRQIQGPRPSPLRVHKVSRTIRKPPLAPALEIRQPVIIYDISPKVIHATVNEFSSVVQRLTGSSSSSSNAAASTSGNISPAARLASIERTSPPERERIGGVHMGGVEMGFYQSQGVLSPAPATLPPIPASMFSPGYQDLSLLNDLSPYMGNYMFTPSPSSLLSSQMGNSVPSPTYFDLLSQYFDS